MNGGCRDGRRNASRGPRKHPRGLTRQRPVRGEASWRTQVACWIHGSLRRQRTSRRAAVLERSRGGRRLLRKRRPTHGAVAQVVRVLCPATRACLFGGGHRRYWSRKTPTPWRGDVTTPRSGDGRRQFTRRCSAEGSAFARGDARILQKTARIRGSQGASEELAVTLI